MLAAFTTSQGTPAGARRIQLFTHLLAVLCCHRGQDAAAGSGRRPVNPRARRSDRGDAEPDPTLPKRPDVHDRLEEALFEIRRVIAGQEGMLERVLVCLLAGGHLLIEGVPGPRQDADDQDDRRRARRHLPPRPVHARPRPVRPRRHARSTGPTAASSTPSSGRSSATSCSPTRSTARPAKVQSALLEVMQEHQVTIGHTTYPVPDPFLVHGDPESDRVGGHVPAAGGADRPLHAEGARRLPGARRGADRRPALARPAAATCGGRSRVDDLLEIQRQRGGGLRRPGADQLGGRRRRRHAARPPTHSLPELTDYIAYGASPRGPISLIAARPRAGADPRP